MKGCLFTKEGGVSNETKKANDFFSGGRERRDKGEGGKCRMAFRVGSKISPLYHPFGKRERGVLFLNARTEDGGGDGFLIVLGEKGSKY